MSQFQKEIVQAVLIADNNVWNFKPLSDEGSTALLPLVNVSMLDYALIALNRSGVEEVFVYASLYLQDIRQHIKQGIATFASWSFKMTVHVIGGEGCRCFGDAMRDLDAKALIRGNFILLGADTVTNADLRPVLEQHKRTAKFDKGAASTLIFKEASSSCGRTGNELLIAMDKQSSRLHYHQRLRMHHKEARYQLPLDIFLSNACVTLHHNLLDPQIAIGSPSMLSLFSDNFDFQTRDDFVRGLLINEELLDSRIYVSLLPPAQYAHKVNNWLSYQMVSRDIISRWAYPLVPDMGVYKLQQQYVFYKDNIYKSHSANVSKVALQENVVVQAGSHVACGTTISCSVIGANCRIGKNCQLNNVFLMANVTIEDNCQLRHCVIGPDAVIHERCVIEAGCVLGPKCVLPANTKLANTLVTSSPNTQRSEENETVELDAIGPKAFIVSDVTTGDPDDSDDDEQLLPSTTTLGIPKMCEIQAVANEASDYSYSSDDDDEESRVATPLPDDTNIFLSEVIDSLTRGFREKSKPEFLILEINSSRYAYNMSLKEVNFNVVKAVFGMESIIEPANNNVLVAINAAFKQLGPVVSNYIKSEDAMIDCLKALEDICEENELVREKISQVVHYLYDKDFVSEDAIHAWYEQLDPTEQPTLRQSLAKLVEWLNQSSEEDDDDDDDDDE
ncbi:translation initiation factor eIF-2B subunit epsilon [Drosophila sulfurigaster albostrigata]|uniref:translation initiation factor eIF-2B subunit epsilon n=1 Tax=Drosophila sulfurigaster albostrigata TaxID=89887 RepID=UPI002D21E079|nr:translation initiation factor eIF-2B subunit epsilon [Drosophila sulfurigaster albostrigata]